MKGDQHKHSHSHKHGHTMSTNTRMKLLLMLMNISTCMNMLMNTYTNSAYQREGPCSSA